MIQNFSLNRSSSAILLIDVQEKLFTQISRAPQLLQKMLLACRAFQILNLPFFVTEQYPKGLGPTLSEIKQVLPASQLYHYKTSFSCMQDIKIKEDLFQHSAQAQDWILLGIEAHVCVLQTAKDLLQSGRRVTILHDAIGSRSEADFLTAVAEMRDMGGRVTSIETALFELLGSSQAAEFKQISALIRRPLA